VKVAYLGIKGIPASGGAERVVEAISTRMPDLGITPTVYCDQQYTPADASVPGVNLVRLPAVSGKYFRSATLDLVTALHAVFKESYDLIHLHNVEASFILPLLRLKYQVVSTSHGAAYWRSKWGPKAKKMIQLMDYPFINWSTETTFVSAKDAQSFGSRFHQETSYIPNGVGLEYVPDIAEAKRILDSQGLTPANYIIFVAGRIEPTKGAHLAIEAVNNLKPKVPLLIVGDNLQVPEYGQRLREMSDSNIHFQPPIREPETLFGLIASAKCLIFPSLFEAMSMVLLEAASIGVPIICSDIEENRNVLMDDGIYFKSGSVEDLTRQLKWTLEHREEAEEVAKVAQERIRHEHSWDTIADQYAQLYRQVLGDLNGQHRE
jgi:glycosyltransferase involved in cell wall biosynthesis